MLSRLKKNVVRAIKEIDLIGAVTEGTYSDEVTNERGEDFTIVQTYYSCGSCIGYDHDEVKSEYIHLIAQLTRRSAFLTIFGLFEHRMSKCLELMMHLCEYTFESKKKLGVVEKTHYVLKNIIGGSDIADLDHLIVIRNIMAHNDGIATDYKEILVRKESKSDGEKRRVRAIRRAEDDKSGISVSYGNKILMDDIFLMYTVGEIQRYVDSLEAAVQTYYRTKHLMSYS
ncbi:MAG: hypothetical protein ACRDD9_24490 [Shewanella sp.]